MDILGLVRHQGTIFSKVMLLHFIFVAHLRYLSDYSVSPSPFGLDFGTMDSGTSDLGLTITIFAVLPFKK